MLFCKTIQPNILVPPSRGGFDISCRLIFLERPFFHRTGARCHCWPDLDTFTIVAANLYNDKKTCKFWKFKGKKNDKPELGFEALFSSRLSPANSYFLDDQLLICGIGSDNLDY